ncbi:MAG: TIGR03790 family protein [Planctomycetota bacterium]|jgi:uncharacterized protein (TIGR03790 family)
MAKKAKKVILAISLFCAAASALELDEVLIIANADCPASVRVAKYYSMKRKVPEDNILKLSLGTDSNDTISRNDYEKKLACPIRKKLSSPEFAGNIRCLLTTYGVPIKVEGRGMLEGRKDKLRQLNKQIERLRSELKQLDTNQPESFAEQKKKLRRKLAHVQSDADRIVGKETNASVDSELSMVMFRNYELYRWQQNQLKSTLPGLGLSTLMVSRLDGPDEKIAQSLVDKAIAAEKATLKGIAYIDSRGLPDDRQPYSPAYFDRSLRDLAMLLKFRTNLTVKHEQTEELFPPGACPRTALYCGWYSLQKYVDAFDFVDGAIGYHIASLEAVDLRDPNSTQWCPAMLTDGITATLGAVAEPYLHSFPPPKAFFLELFNGRCLVEAYYYTKPFNSWQLVLIGDPLYRPFKITP